MRIENVAGISTYWRNQFRSLCRDRAWHLSDIPLLADRLMAAQTEAGKKEAASACEILAFLLKSITNIKNFV